MYKEGRSLVQEAAKEVEGVVKDAKQIKKDALGVFSFFSKLFGLKPKPEAAKEKPKPAPLVKKKRQPPPEFDENAVYAEVGQALMVFFKAQNALTLFIQEEEEKALHIIENADAANDIAVKLVMANLQMEKLSQELTDYMVYEVPGELKDLYGRIHKMLGKIADQQKLARMEELQRERERRWLKRQQAEHLQDRLMYATLTLLLIAWTWLTLLTIIPSSS